MTRLPKTVRDFIKRQATVPIGKVWTCDPKKWRSPYGSCWYKATACMLLSGRVGAKWGGHPNKTELNRLCEELRVVLKDLEPLPKSVAALLGTKSKLGGAIDIRWCSALVKPQEPETLTAIRHPKLRGYLEVGAPPGYLLVKGSSNLDNFVYRCRALGFDVSVL